MFPKKIGSQPSSHSGHSSPRAETLRECQLSLVMSQINGGNIQGSIKPQCDQLVSGPKIQAESLQTRFKIMKRVVAKCPSVDIKIMGENRISLLDIESMVSLMWQTYFNIYFRLQLRPAEGAVAKALNLFH